MKQTEAQQKIIETGLLNSGFSCVLQMPTGSGKTWLAEQAIQAVLDSGSRAIYLTPLRALATELLGRWQKLFSNSEVGVFTGDYGIPGNQYPVTFNEARLLIMTPERLDACTRAWRAHWSWFPKIDLLVIDELHLLGDRQRGARLEGAISRFRRLNPFARILGLSATLGNRHELADWLDGVEFHSDWRPIPIKWQIIRYRQASQKPEILADCVSDNVGAGGKSLVFVQSRRRAEALNSQLQSKGLRSSHHHAGLKLDDRHNIEDRFRGNEYDVLVSTATLEMGLNLPVRQVVLYDLQSFDGTDFQPLSTNTVWQRIGRAGRRGLDTEGEAVLLAPTWDNQVDQYLLGKFEPIRSGLFDQRALAEQIVAEVASGLSRSLNQLKATFNRSLTARQRSLPKIEGIVWEMRQAGMLEAVLDEENETRIERLRATRMGRIAVRHFLTPATVLLFREAFNKYPELTFFDLLLIAASSEDCEPILPADYEELDPLANYLSKEKSVLLHSSRREITELLGINGKRLLAALKMALVARDWTRLSNADEVAEKHGCYPFEVERLGESLQRLLLAMFALFEEVKDEEAAESCLPRQLEHIPLRERVKVLHQMVAAGINESAATLTVIDGIGPKSAKRLYQNGIADIEDLASAEIEDLLATKRLSRSRAERWINEAKEKIRARSAFSYLESEPTANVKIRAWSSEIDPYRLRRAIDLKIAGAEGGIFRITGGLEPHIVRTISGNLICDCQDAARAAGQSIDRQHQCKHILAIKLHRGDSQLKKLVRQLKTDPDQSPLNLFDLWQGNNLLAAKVKRA